MKTRRTLKAIYFSFPVIVATVGNALLYAQERVNTLTGFQNGWIGYGVPHESHSSSLDESRNLKLKSENTALALSLGGTLIPMGVGTALVLAATDANSIKSEGSYLAGNILFASGLYFGPSLGYFYGGRSDRAWKGIGVRFVIALATSVGTVLLLQTFEGLDVASVTFAASMVGGMFLLASAIYDISGVKSAIRKRNQFLRDNALTITPTYLVEHDAPGFKVLVSF